MADKLLWTGLTLIVISPIITVPIPAVAIVGAVLMALGVVLKWLDK